MTTLSCSLHDLLIPVSHHRINLPHANGRFMASSAAKEGNDR